jgi:hypothetical protein
MKKHINYVIISLFIVSPIILIAQEKDSLFFAIDKYYTISPTITPNLHIQTYPERVEAQKKQILETKTNGYVSFIGNGVLIKGLKPKKILSIKDYIENRKFYHDGKHNQIVDTWKLKDSLTDKYEVFFVNGDEFIQPRILEYYSYYPLKDGDRSITNPIKDTLYFNLDNNYITQSEHDSNIYYLEDSGKSGDVTFRFTKMKSIKNIKYDKLLDIKNFIHLSRFYDDSKKYKLKDFDLTNYLSNYIIYLVDKKEEEIEFIEVSPGFEIE